MLETVGQGGYGKVYRGCYNKKCRYKYAVKKQNSPGLIYEYRMLQLLHPVDSKHIPKPLDFKKDPKGDLMFQEFLELKNSMNKNINFKKVLKQTLKTLLKIQKKFPSFRHNDLSYRNVFVTTSGNVYIGDFGLAYINMNGYRNPLVKSKQFMKSYGTFPKSSQKFDMHFLLNSYYIDGTSEMRKYIETLLPKEYLGVNTKYVHNARLRWNVDHSLLPSTRQIFSSIITK